MLNDVLYNMLYVLPLDELKLDIHFFLRFSIEISTTCTILFAHANFYFDDHDLSLGLALCEDLHVNYILFIFTVAYMELLSCYRKEI